MKTKTIRVRVEDDEHAAAAAAAKADGRTISDWVRRLIRAAVGK